MTLWTERETAERLLTADDVAARLCVSRAWVHDHAKRRQPRLPVVRLGGDRKALLRFRAEDIERFIRANLVDDSGGGGVA